MFKKIAHPESQRGSSPPSLAEVIRSALCDLGVYTSPAKVKEWITRHHATLRFKESTFNSSLSSIRKKLKTDTNGINGEPTVNDLLKVKEMADANGGIGEIIALLDKVDNLAKRVGGIGRLRQCIAGLQKLRM
jgi:hypothetical protein